MFIEPPRLTALRNARRREAGISLDSRAAGFQQLRLNLELDLTIEKCGIHNSRKGTGPIRTRPVRYRQRVRSGHGDIRVA